jgi:nucleotide-binding universal stress UspA family protein
MKKILVALDSKEHARKALTYVADLARNNNTCVYLMHVIPDESIPDRFMDFMKLEHIDDPPWYSYKSTLKRAVLSPVEEELRENGVKNVQSLVFYGNPAKTIVKTAREIGADTIVLVSRGLGILRRLLNGSVSEKVSHLAGCSCVTVR